MLKNTVVFTVGILIFFTMGCERTLNEIIAKSDDTILSATTVSVKPGEKPDPGTVFIGGLNAVFGTDRYVLNTISITDDTLTLNVSYGGGCRTHQFTLIASESFMESFPVQLRISLAHNANADLCRAWLTEDLQFDLTPIKTLYQEGYRQEAGTIILRLKDAPDGELIYEFTM